MALFSLALPALSWRRTYQVNGPIDRAMLRQMFRLSHLTTNLPLLRLSLAGPIFVVRWYLFSGVALLLLVI